MSIERIPVHLVLHQMEHDWYMLSKWVTRAIQGFTDGISTLIALDHPTRLLMIVLRTGNQVTLQSHHFLCTDTKSNEIWGETEGQEKVGENPSILSSPISADTVDDLLTTCERLLEELKNNNDGRIHSLLSPKNTIIKSLKTIMCEIKKYQAQ
jgi:hypothetical protein